MSNHKFAPRQRHSESMSRPLRKAHHPIGTVVVSGVNLHTYAESCLNNDNHKLACMQMHLQLCSVKLNSEGQCN